MDDDKNENRGPEEQDQLDDELEAVKDALEEDQELDKNTLFTLLSNNRRRYIMEYMLENRDHKESFKTGELAEHVAAIENDKSPEQITSGEREKVYVGLYQGHLDTLDKIDLVEYNKDRGLVEPGEHFDEVKWALADEVYPDNQHLEEYVKADNSEDSFGLYLCRRLSRITEKLSPIWQD